MTGAPEGRMMLGRIGNRYRPGEGRVMPVPFIAQASLQGFLSVMVLGVLGLTAVLIAVPAILAYHWRIHRATQAYLQLKREMVQRGMSAGEIERVIQATSIPELIQQGLSTKAVERLIRATGFPLEAEGKANGIPIKGAPLDLEI